MEHHLSEGGWHPGQSQWGPHPGCISALTLPLPCHIGPSMRKVGPQHYLKEEMAAAREAVQSLDQAVAKASSYREKASRLLEEAHRALSRLEQV